MATGTRIDTDPLLGVGVYSLSRAAMLAGAPRDQFSRWALGYTRKRHGCRVVYGPVIAHEVPSLASDNTITFRDLMELLFVRHFVDAGVDPHVVKEAARRAREHTGLSHPFASGRFCTDGARIFRDIAEGASIERGVPAKRRLTDVAAMQQVIVSVIQPYLRDYITIEHDAATSYRPPEGNGEILIDRRRRFGRPIVESAGIETEVLSDCYASYGSTEAVSRWFGIDESAVTAAIRYEAAIRPHAA